MQRDIAEQERLEQEKAQKIATLARAADQNPTKIEIADVAYADDGFDETI